MSPHEKWSEPVSSFLGAYFYEQSEFDYETHLTSIESVLADGHSEYHFELLTGFRKVRDLRLDEGQLDDLLLSLGASYVPCIEMSTARWLDASIALIEQHLGLLEED